MFWQVIEMCTICIFGFLLLLSDSLFVEEKGGTILLKSAIGCTAQTQLMQLLQDRIVCYSLRSSFSMSFTISRGEVVGEYLLTGTPCLSHRNFVKFHLMLFVSVPCLAFFRKTYSGSAFDPLTSILPNMSNSTP